MANFPYNNNVPNPPDNPSADVADMQTNTNSIGQIIAIDHLGFNTTNSGFHNIIHFNRQLSDPGPMGLTGQLYTKTINSGGHIDESLFFESGAGRIFQLTTNPNGPGILNPVNGYSFLPGGALIQWGTQSGNNVAVTFPIAFPSNVFTIQTTIFQNTTNRHFVYVKTQSLTGFQPTQLDAGGATENSTFSWMAVGN